MNDHPPIEYQHRCNCCGNYTCACAPKLTPGQRAILDDIPVLPQKTIAAMAFPPAEAALRRTLELHVITQIAERSLAAHRENVPVAQREAVERAANDVLSRLLVSDHGIVSAVLAVAQARWQLHLALNAQADHNHLCRQHCASEYPVTSAERDSHA